MKFKRLFFLLLFFIPFQALVYSTSGVCGFGEEDDDSVYLGFRQFGKFGSNRHDLDAIHDALAKEESLITQEVRKKDPKNKNNIVLGCLAVIVENEDGRIIIIKKKIKIFKEGKEKLRAFESAGKLILKDNKALKKYSFEDELAKVPELVEHVSKIWGRIKEGDSSQKWIKREDFSPREKDIWKKFKDLQAGLWEKKEQLKSLIVETALTNYTQGISSLALDVASSERREAHHQTETLRDRILVNKTKSPSELLKIAEKEINNKRKEFEQVEKEFEAYATMIYRWFWHSEQRLIHFFSSPISESFWESLLDKVQGKVKGAFLHLHSHYNLCPTCRRAVARASVPGGMLWKRMQAKLAPQEETFFFKVLASFRVQYGPQDPRTNEKDWVPHKVFASAGSAELVSSHTAPPLYLKKVWLGEEEEQEEGNDYMAAWRAHLTLQRKIKKDNVQYQRELHSFLEAYVNDFKERIDLIKKRRHQPLVQDASLLVPSSSLLPQTKIPAKKERSKGKEKRKGEGKGEAKRKGEEKGVGKND
ncbi:MAG: hypothetical protein BGO67_07740 [Alphaproteobacteria bacterium 41-28]|nr:MAG: hypothetical protein BGO67_07740 [Alphaproteobacteria bacterium 41-28]